MTTLLPAAAFTRLSTVDLAIVAAYLAGITLFGLRFRGNKDKSLRGYFLAGRTIPWWAIALSIVSAETSTLTIISVPGIAFAGDMGFLQIVFGYLLGRVVVALLFLPRYFQGELLTAYQLIDRRFGTALHRTTAILFLFTRAAAEGVRVFAISIVVGIAIGTGDTLSIAIISALTLLYTFEGGMAAVVWTDVVQMAIYIAGTLVAVATLGARIPGGWSTIHAVGAHAGKFQVLHFALNLSQTYTFWAGLLGGTFLTMASHGTDQLMVQRLLAAKNLAQSRVALLSSGLVIFFQFSLFLLIGVGLFVFYGQHPHDLLTSSGAPQTPDRLFPTFIVQQMPPGVAGLLIAAILAAAMSNLSAALNSLSSTTVVDLWMGWRPAAGDTERTRVARGSTVLWALVLFAIALVSVRASGHGHVVEIGLSIASVSYGALLGVFLLGTLNPRATQAGAILGMILGFLTNLLLWQHPAPLTLGPVTIPHIAFTWYVLIGSLLTFAVGSLASLFLGARPRTRSTTAGLLLLAALSLSPHLHAQSAAPPATPSIGKPAENLSAPAHIPDFTATDHLITAAIAAQRLPGAVLEVGHAGHVVHQKAYGNRAEDPAVEPMTVDTIFDMASLSKCLSTATAIMQLYEQDKLHFDDPLVQYLPDFATPTDPRRAQVTLRMLLTHTSGEAPDVDLKDPWGLATPDKAEGIHRALITPLQDPPGKLFRYSDINYILLGALVEKLSGQPLDEYAEQHIFQPLGMLDTRYHPFSKVCGPHQTLGSNIAVDQTVAGATNQVCDREHWRTVDAQSTAPTAHDSEGTRITNPDFDRVLRGTVHDPTTRRMGGVAGQAGVFSTAHDIGLYAQALLDRLAGRPSTFPLQQATLLLMTTPEQPGHTPADLTQFPANIPVTYPSHKGHDVRGFGWDIDTAFSRPRGVVFPIGSFGHTGYTGTTLWMDPGSDTYVVLLTNAVHPRDKRGPISGLRGEVASAAARALDLYPERATAVAAPPPTHASTPPPLASEPTLTGREATLTGIDVLESTNFAAFREAAARHGNHLRLGLLTNQTGLDSHGHRTVDILAHEAAAAVPGLTLTTLFSPEHGISGARDSTDIADARDPATNLPIRSLYGVHDADRRPKPDDLRQLDAVIVDLQDAGVRTYTYEALTGYFLEAAATAGIELIVLDRPALLGGLAVQGPVSDPGLESYNNYMPMPLRHGMTLGELARFFNGERHLNTQLTVVPLEHWTRPEYFDETGLAWTNPSPNLQSERAAVLFPALTLLELTNVSVGRGSATPFELFGAGTSPASPQAWFHAADVVRALTARNIPGITFEATTAAIREDADHYPFHGQTIEVVRLNVTDRVALDSSELGIELLSALHALYPQQFALGKAARLMASSSTMQALTAGTDPRSIANSWQPLLNAFNTRRALYLLYP